MEFVEDTISVTGLTLEPKMNDINPFILADHQFIKENLPEAAIVCLSKEFITVVIMRTAYSRVQLRIQFSADYPSECPIVELSSPSLPQPLLRNKEKECMDKAKTALNQSQAKIIFEHISSFIYNNMFIPCWKEMKQIATLCESKGVKINCNEQSGEVAIGFTYKMYKQNFTLKVPLMYPEEGVSVEFKASNYPLDIQFMFKSQVDELIRRCLAGYSPENAMNNTIDLEAVTKKASESKVVLTSGSIKNLKHDVNVLKQISDLREATSATSKGYQANVIAERREARKDLRRLAKQELEIDAKKEEELKALEEEEMKILMRSKISSTAQPSLFAAVRFLIENYALYLPQESCQACKKLIFAEDPSSSAMVDKNDKQRPMRTFCGHWFHYVCLNEWLTTPPFIRNCGVCERRIWHPDWPEDVKQIEKAWQNQQAKKREVSDVADLMGF